MENYKFLNLLFVLCYLLIAPNLLAKEVVLDKIAAQVNDQVILLSELKNTVVAQQKALKALGKKGEVKQKEVLEQLIDEKLIDQQLKKRGLSISSQEVERAEQQIIKQNGLSNSQQLRQVLTEQGASYTTFRKNLRKQIEQSKVVNVFVKPRVNISESDLKSRYRQNIETTGKRLEIELQSLTFKLPAKPKERKKVIAKIKRLKKRGEKGEDFTKLVKRFSQARDGKSGGRWDKLRLDQLNPNLAQAVDHLKIGEISEPVFLGPNVHIFKLLDKKIIGSYPFAEVKDKIEQELTVERTKTQYQKWLNELKEKAHIKRNL